MHGNPFIEAKELNCNYSAVNENVALCNRKLEELYAGKASKADKLKQAIAHFEEEGREKLEWKDVQVDKMEAKDNNLFPFLSDHYGISAVFSFPSKFTFLFSIVAFSIHILVCFTPSIWWNISVPHSIDW